MPCFCFKEPGIYTLQEYADVLKTDYPEQLLQKYKAEAGRMASYTGDGKKYRQPAVLLRNMQKIKGGSKAAGAMAAERKTQYINRPE